ncbi:hypothetical protein NBRC3293_2157 [Gluconobacter oxydans NBRC 3293]|uniref:Uncharacterized protein n=1 Tax=Gluconobacter oxydans NBRC 3293 TaxID=1315969 RepID=A0A829X492_GLUOY|nr:hypothetical protein NBRC3293_2157 [Gluconobacter oxydans NBRC 3293]
MKKDPSIVRHRHVTAMTAGTINPLLSVFHKKSPVRQA